MSPTMSVAMEIYLEPFAPFRVGDAEGEEGDDGFYIECVPADGGERAREEDENEDQGAQQSVFHNLIFRLNECRLREEELAALAGFALDPDASAMREHDFARDAQAEAGALVPAFGDAKELVENTAL